MTPVPFLLMAIMPLLLLLGWMRSRLEYGIVGRRFRITLFGITLRSIPIDSIRQVSKKRVRWSENWINTLKPAHKILTIHKRSGIFKHVVITPPNRYILMAELQKALDGAPAGEPQRAAPDSNAGAPAALSRSSN